MNAAQLADLKARVALAGVRTTAVTLAINALVADAPAPAPSPVPTPPPPAPIPAPPAPTPPAPSPAPGGWLGRALALPGTTQAIDFTAAVVKANANPNGTQANVVSEVFEGENVLRINIPKSSDDDPGSWRCSLNKSWTKNNQAFGVGQVFEVAYLIYMGPGYLSPSNGGGGKKQSIISQYQPETPSASSSHTDIEIVAVQSDNRILAYHDPAATGFYVQLPNGDFNLQTARPQCLYSNPSVGCLNYVESVWQAVRFRIQVAKFNGSAGNRFSMWRALPGDADWTPVFDNTGFQLGADGAGYSGLWHLPYDTNRTSGKLDTFVRYKHSMVSTQPIALASMF